jgi:hypothetical protein
MANPSKASHCTGAYLTRSKIDALLGEEVCRRFRKIVAGSDFVAERFDALPIRRLAWLANPLTREFTTACVRCELVPKPAYEVARARIA